MTVKELKDILANTPEHLSLEEFDNMTVLIPLDGTVFDGYFVTPCTHETSVSELGINEEGDETMESFVIAPHGFFDEQRQEIKPELN